MGLTELTRRLSGRADTGLLVKMSPLVALLPTIGEWFPSAISSSECCTLHGRDGLVCRGWNTGKVVDINVMRLEIGRR